MDVFLQQVVNGLSIASIFALVAIGITLIFGLTGLVMFAHGELLMLGGYVTFVTVASGGSFFVGLVFAALAMALAGLVLERGLFRFTLNKPVNGFIISLGLIIVFQHLALKIWTGEQRVISKPISTVFDVGDIRITGTRLMVIGLTVALVAIAFVVIDRSRYGKALRASAEDREAATMMGVPAKRYITAIFVFGGAAAGLGGGLLLGLFAVTPFVGATFVIKGFAVALIGGLGNIQGAVLAALILGIVEAMSAGYLWPAWTDAYSFVLMILILLFRPQGLLAGTKGGSLA